MNECICCNFKTTSKFNFDRHMKTTMHLKKVSADEPIINKLLYIIKELTKECNRPDLLTMVVGLINKEDKQDIILQEPEIIVKSEEIIVKSEEIIVKSEEIQLPNENINNDKYKHLTTEDYIFLQKHMNNKHLPSEINDYREDVDNVLPIYNEQSINVYLEKIQYEKLIEYYNDIPKDKIPLYKTDDIYTMLNQYYYNEYTPTKLKKFINMFTDPFLIEWGKTLIPVNEDIEKHRIQPLKNKRYKLLTTKDFDFIRTLQEDEDHEEIAYMICQYRSDIDNILPQNNHDYFKIIQYDHITKIYHNIPRLFIPLFEKRIVYETINSYYKSPPTTGFELLSFTNNIGTNKYLNNWKHTLKPLYILFEYLTEDDFELLKDESIEKYEKMNEQRKYE